MIVKSPHPDIVNDVYDFFNKKIFTINNFSVKQIWFSNTLTDDAYKYCSENASDAQGVTSVTNDECPKLIIILQDSLNEYDLIRVLIHELVHACDFTEYFEVYHNGIPGHYITDKLSFTFTLYTEFHAQFMDDLYAYIYFDDMYSSTIFIESLQLNYKDYLNTFINNLCKNSHNKPIDLRTVVVVLAKIFLLDILSMQPTPSTSCIYSYISQLLGDYQTGNWVYKFYGLLWDSIKNHHGLENLSQIHELLTSQHLL